MQMVKLRMSGSENDNEIKLTDDSTCQGLIDNLQKGMDACEAKLASANAIITETAEVRAMMTMLKTFQRTKMVIWAHRKNA